jgi:glycyl-tRNA synthetase beta chain
VALADKLDLLVSFFAIGEVPTGSKDPFALRRAALGAIRLIRAEGAPASVRVMVQAAAQSAEDGSGGGLPARAAIVEEVATFIFERLKVLLREEGRRHDIIDAAAAAAADDLVDLIRRVEILSDFVATDGGEALLAGLRRALNILKAEARKPAERPEATDPPTASARADPDADAHADVASEEAGLKAALATCRPEVEAALASGDFAFALRALSSLRGPIDAFFNAVLVNDPDPAKRAGRLTLLRQIRQLAVQVADFSLLSG